MFLFVCVCLKLTTLCQDLDAGHVQAQLPPFKLKDKGKTPARDGRSAFRHSPYSHPPSSVGSASSARIGGTSTKIASSPSTKTPISAQFKELDRQSEALLENKGSASGSRAALRYNYAIRKQELNNKREERVAQQANAEVEFMREQELKKLDIQLKKQEERAYDCQIEVLRLQIQYQQVMHVSGANGPCPATGSLSTTGLDLSSSPPFPLV